MTSKYASSFETILFETMIGPTSWICSYAFRWSPSIGAALLTSQIHRDQRLSKGRNAERPSLKLRSGKNVFPLLHLYLVYHLALKLSRVKNSAPLHSFGTLQSYETRSKRVGKSAVIRAVAGVVAFFQNC